LIVPKINRHFIRYQLVNPELAGPVRNAPEKRAADYLFTLTLLSTGEFINVKKAPQNGAFD